MKPRYWWAPELWPGETFALLAGGPSLTQQQADACRGRARVVAINDSLRLAPWASVHYFCDDKWHRWHSGKDWYQNFKGLRVTLENPEVCRQDWTCNGVQNVGTSGFCEQRSGLMTGRNSGYQAINLAVHLGAARILLLGYDMRADVVQGRNKTHWFGDHPGGTSPGVYQTMLPHFPSLIEPLKRRGIEIVNCTPGSALGCFKKMELKDALECDALTA